MVKKYCFLQLERQILALKSFLSASVTRLGRRLAEDRLQALLSFQIGATEKHLHIGLYLDMGGSNSCLGHVHYSDRYPLYLT